MNKRRCPKMAAVFTGRGIELHPARLEKWYREQAQRWAALEGQGWQFFGPSKPESERVGIGMRRKGVTCVATILKGGTFHVMHTALLNACEEMAKQL